jgi:hypothetical protein
LRENYRQSQLSTADIAQQQAEESTFGPDQPMEQEDYFQDGRSMALIPREDTDRLQSRWAAIQADFVDNPTTSVEAADSLVAQVMKRVAEVFTEEREQLETQWRQGEDVSTEDLRVALQRYRSFFNRLLSLQ